MFDNIWYAKNFRVEHEKFLLRAERCVHATKWWSAFSFAMLYRFVTSICRFGVENYTHSVPGWMQLIWDFSFCELTCATHRIFLSTHIRTYKYTTTFMHVFLYNAVQFHARKTLYVMLMFSYLHKMEHIRWTLPFTHLKMYTHSTIHYKYVLAFTFTHTHARREERKRAGRR